MPEPTTWTPPNSLSHERDIERHLVRVVESLGGETRKVQWVGRTGAPDRFVMLAGSYDWYARVQRWQS